MAEHKMYHVLAALEASPARTRRIWSRAAKDLILAEASVAGANISAVARAHGVSVHQVFIPASILNHKTKRTGIPSDSINL
jgi:hypothetical protein